MGVEFNKKYSYYFLVEWYEPILKWCENIVEELVRASFTTILPMPPPPPLPFQLGQHTALAFILC